MKILLVDFALPYLIRDADYPVGGWAVEQKAWIAGLQSQGHEVRVASWTGAGEYAQSDVFLDLYDPAKGLRFLKIFYRQFPAIYRCVSDYQPDCIMQGVRGYITGLFALVAKIKKIPFVYRVASDADVDGRYKDYLKKYESFLYKKGLNLSSLILCQNQYQYQCVDTEYGDKKLSLIVSNPFEMVTSNILKNRPVRSYVAWLANFSSKKNLKLLAVIANRMPHIQFKVGGQLVGVGDAETVSALEALKKLHNVKMAGCIARTDIPEFLGGALLLLNTSRMEGFSNTFLEAFFSGTPVVCRRAVDPGHIIEQELLGGVAEDEDGLIFAIDEIALLPIEQYDALSSRCLKYVRENHAPEDKANQLVDALLTLKNNRESCS